MIRVLILIILFGGLSDKALSDQVLFSEKVLFLKSNDPRQISFIYEDGDRVSGTYFGIKQLVVWELSNANGSQWFNLSYTIDKGLVLRHLSNELELRLVSQVSNHPLNRLLSACYEKVGGSSMGIQSCLNRHDSLLEVEISRAYRLLKDNGEQADELLESWREFSSQQYAYIRRFYSKFQGSKWGYKSMEDIVAIDEAHLDMLNNWVARLLSNTSTEADT
ncbi:hypothetical protein OAR44_03180 [Acidimicrobiia bacterium]|jgi:hypothetical protein|nr:hypothetical protein [Porticoccaceae bacterium]MDC0133872.1 hypothetical protein [Porticoccaceae bacterium]MDC0978391.1 hypothetical protein [Acidimicrobiia bacterium]MDC1477235.1 hypothetical protein [Porticoccaceae bacterium]